MNYVCYYMLSFKSIVYIMLDVNYGFILRYLHTNGASLFMLLIYFHLYRGLCYNSYCRSLYLWITGLMLLLLSILESFLGYILPFGQMSYWAVIVILGFVSVIPLIGHMLSIYFLCSYTQILNHIIGLHFIVGYVLLLIVILHIVILHSICSINSIFSSIFIFNSSTWSCYFIYFWPLIIMKDFSLTMCWVLILSCIFIVNASLFGNCDNSIPAYVLITPIHIIPEWYFLIFYSFIRSFPNKSLGILVLFFIIFNCFGLKNEKSFSSFQFIPINDMFMTGYQKCRFITMIHFYRTFYSIEGSLFIFLTFYLFIFGAWKAEDYYLSIQRISLFAFLSTFSNIFFLL